MELHVQMLSDRKTCVQSGIGPGDVHLLSRRQIAVLISRRTVAFSAHILDMHVLCDYKCDFYQDDDLPGPGFELCIKNFVSIHRIL